MSAALQQYAAVRSMLYSFTRNRADADELTQDVYRHLCEMGLEVLRGIKNVQAYMRTMGLRRGQDWQRGRARQKRITDPEPLPPEMPSAADTEAEVEDLQLQERTERAVAGLPSRRRYVLVRCAGHGASLDEVAQELGISSATVRRELQAAVIVVRDSLGTRHGERHDLE